MARDIAAPGQATDYVRAQIARSQSRSMVMSVARHRRERASAGLAGRARSILARGGHAVDAAIAANAVMGVVAPMMNGVGGDLFAIVYDAATGAAARHQRQRLRAGGADDRLSPRARHHARCRRPASTRSPFRARWPAWALLQRALRPQAARRRARARRSGSPTKGFRLPEITAAEWAGSETLLGADAEATRRLSAGRPRAARRARSSEIRTSPRPIAQLAAGGRDAFYRGDIAAAHRRLLATSTAAR